MKINIKSLEIKNFRAIKAVSIDFFNNKNGIERELKRGKFKLSGDDKHSIASHYAIMARNSMGKTTILEAISLYADSFSGRLHDLIVREMWESSSSEKANPFLNALPQMPNLNSYIEFKKKISDAVKNKKGSDYHLYSSKMMKFYEKYFELNSNDKNKNIEMVLSLFVEEKAVDILLKITSDGILSLDYNFIETNEDKAKKYIESINEYIRTISIFSNKYPFTGDILQTTDIRKVLDDVDYIQKCILWFIETFKMDKTIRLLQLADDKILKPNILKLNNGTEMIDVIILKNGSKIRLSDLSAGTRHFIILFAHINRNLIFKDKNGLVLIDEIELSLHAELIDVLKISMQFLFEQHNCQFIFTTHNPLAVINYTTTKQIISLEDEDEEGFIKSRKMSSMIKPSQSILKAYQSGSLSPYPDSELSRNTIVDIYTDE